MWLPRDDRRTWPADRVRSKFERQIMTVSTLATARPGLASTAPKEITQRNALQSHSCKILRQRLVLFRFVTYIFLVSTGVPCCSRGLTNEVAVARPCSGKGLVPHTGAPPIFGYFRYLNKSLHHHHPSKKEEQPDKRPVGASCPRTMKIRTTTTVGRKDLLERLFASL